MQRSTLNARRSNLKRRGAFPWNLSVECCIEKTAPAEPCGIPPACLFAAGCKPNSVFLRKRRKAIISLGRLSPAGSSSLPADVPAFAGAPCGRGSPLIWPCCRWGLPCRPGHPRRGALLPHHFTLTGRNPAISPGGFLSVALSVGLLRLDVIKHQTRQGGVTRPSAVRTFLTPKPKLRGAIATSATIT